MDIKEYLKKKKLIADGAFGTYFSQINNTNQTISEISNIENPELVKKIHREYISAGARLLRTNTFAANKRTIGNTDEYRKELIKRGYSLALEAAKESEEIVFVAADIGPIPVDIHTEKEEIIKEYQMICDAFLECGADIFLFETFPDIRYIKPVIKYLKEKNGDIFIITQFSLNRYGYTRSGVSAKRLLEAIKEIDEIDAVGFNCGIGSGHLYSILRKLNLNIGKYISAMPNSGYPEMVVDRTVYLDNIGYFSEKLIEIADLGISIIGGCCGTNPDYIKEAKKHISLEPVNWKSLSVTVENDNVNKTKVSNKFYEKLMRGEKVIAVELDPPYDSKIEKIMECANILKADHVDMLTFADSPMGRGRVDSVLMSTKVSNEVDIPVMPHIACRDKNMISMRAGILGGYIHNIRNFLLVTGDPVPSADRDSVSSVFDFNSVKLMEYVKEMNLEHFVEDPICYGGALNHGRRNIEFEIDKMRKKKEAGAAYFLTQPIYSDEDIERIRYIKSQIDTKIICGVMPLISYRNALFIKNEITGINVPDEVLELYKSEMTKEEGEAVGISVVREVIKKLDSVADGYYFMLPFNRVHLVKKCLE